jgi:hypothetical protein
MKPRLSVLTICVDDLERALRFYRDGLGLQTPGIIGEEFEYGAVVFFDLQRGLKLVGLNRLTLRGKRKVNTSGCSIVWSHRQDLPLRAGMALTVMGGGIVSMPNSSRLESTVTINRRGRRDFMPILSRVTAS